MVFNNMRDNAIFALNHAISPLPILILFLAALVARFLFKAVYNVFFHPLRNFPGPTLAAATPLPFAWRICNGRMVDWTTSVHQQYGEVVRIHPDELSFVRHTAWQDIYGSRPGFPRPTFGINPPANGVPALPVTPKIEDHTRQRRILHHAFSDRVFREQEQLLYKHTDTLIKCLRDQTRRPNSDPDTNICEWCYFTTFDIIGDLCFSEAFHSLERAETHPWKKAVFTGIKIGRILTAFDCFPPLGTIMRWCIGHIVKGRIQQNFDWTRQKIDIRIGQKSSRPDILKFVLENNHTEGMSRDEIDSTVTMLLLAGSSDTAVAAMTALTYFTLKNPTVMDRLQKEIRSALGHSPENVTVAAVSKLEYLDAVLREAMRMHAPVPTSNPVVVDRPGVYVCGIPIPQGTRVGISQKTAYRLPCNFVEPESFLPERWLPDPQGRFALDNKAIFEPFLVGERRCLGKSIALAEMKLILCKVFLHFDLTLSGKNQGNWCDDQKSYLINDNTPLYVRLEPRTPTATQYVAEA